MMATTWLASRCRFRDGEVGFIVHKDSHGVYGEGETGNLSIDEKVVQGSFELCRGQRTIEHIYI